MKKGKEHTSKQNQEKIRKEKNEGIINKPENDGKQVFCQNNSQRRRQHDRRVLEAEEKLF